ncbi:MAG: F0F1 ATP synthase subunit epsilon [Nitrospiraceae bacterium]|nr:F0F1 ATP synthase subunit epsilon [Nitrospiraceae bacterium]
MDKLKLEIVTPRGSAFSGEVDEVFMAKGGMGEFGVLAGHAPLLTTLRIGAFITKTDGKPSYYFVGAGFAEVNQQGMVVLADSAERAEDIDVNRAMAAKQRAEALLAKKDSEDFAHVQSALDRAMERIRIAEEHGRK